MLDTTPPSLMSGHGTAKPSRFLLVLAAAYAVLWLALAIDPFDRFDWFLENLLVLAAVAVLALTYRRFPLSDPSYLLIALFLALHAFGAHYTYSETPLGAFAMDLWGGSRNHYDRAVHFAFGLLLTFPFFEFCRRVVGANRGPWIYLFAFCLVVTFSSIYEMLEWITAMVIEPEAAMVFLGTQGDVFDAQKDSALAALGSVLALSATRIFRPGRRPRIDPDHGS